MLTTTMEKIAAEARLSRYTVSKILNGDMTVKKRNRDLVLSLCDKYGYVPNHYAVSLVRGQSNIIAILVPYITDGFYSEIIESAEKYASAKGFRTIYQSSYNNAKIEAKILRGFLALKVSAVIMVPVVKNPDIRLHRLIASNIPMIYLDRTVDPEASSVLNNNESSASVMTEHLLEKTRNVAFFDSFYGDLNQTALARRSGYIKAMEQHGCETSFIPTDNSAEQQDNERYGYENMKAYLKNNPAPKALFCITDSVALGAMRAAVEMGLAPGKDILVGGHDNLHFAPFISPSLTTMEQPKRELAEASVDMAMQMMQGAKNNAQKQVYQSRLIIRESSGGIAENAG
ncbi:MAG: LacI family transcriptional regulator [Oligosphaeraceae bacterium]|nr:LacI family transcriptional regulator [Oligosphaeraceae bacterium]